MNIVIFSILYTVAVLILIGIAFCIFDALANWKKKDIKNMHIDERYIIADKTLKIFYSGWHDKSIYLTEKTLAAEEFSNAKLAAEQIERFCRAENIIDENGYKIILAPELKVWKRNCSYTYEVA